MKIIDLHIHTSHSFDSSTMIEDYINVVRNYTNSIVGFCEHFEDNFDVGKYLEGIEYYSFKYKSFFKIIKGIEVSIEKKDLLNDKIKYINNYVDYILWSNHNFNNRDLISYYNELKEFIINYDEKIDLIGHIDFPFRFIDFSKFDYNSQVESEINTLLAEIVKKEIPLEFNYYNYKNNFNNFEKIFQIIWKNYFLLGGKYISFGSDSHDIKNFLDYLKNFNLYYNFVKDKCIIYYINHKRELFNI